MDAETISLRGTAPGRPSVRGRVGALGWGLRAALLLALLLGGFTLYGWTEAQRDPAVVQYTVGLNDWPAGVPPLRVVQLSDLHIGLIDMPPARVRRIVAQVNALKPDLVVLTGDYDGGKFWEPPLKLSKRIAPLGGLKARYGVFAVLGNHDTRYFSAWAFGRAGVPLLQGKWAEAGPVVVAGVVDLVDEPDPHGAVAQAVKGAPPGKPMLMLVHEPDTFTFMPPQVDLLFAGHTHGGQIRLPLFGTVDMGPFMNAHLRGHFTEGGKQLIVSSGVGTTGVPLRIGVPPEIVLATVGPSYSTGRKSGTER